VSYISISYPVFLILAIALQSLCIYCDVFDTSTNCGDVFCCRYLITSVCFFLYVCILTPFSRHHSSGVCPLLLHSCTIPIHRCSEHSRLYSLRAVFILLFPSLRFVTKRCVSSGDKKVAPDFPMLTIYTFVLTMYIRC